MSVLDYLNSFLPPDFILALNKFFMVLRLIIADTDKW